MESVKNSDGERFAPDENDIVDDGEFFEDTDGL